MPPMRPAIVIYTNCQGQALAGLLARHPALQGHDFVFLRAWLKDQPRPADLQRCVAYLHQPAWGDADFVDQLPASAVRIALPLLSCSVLWPHAFDRPDEPVGWRFPYGDRFLIAQLRAGQTPEAAVDTYLAMDMPAKLKLDRLLALEVQRWQQDDARCGTDLAPFIARKLRRERLFYTPDHPSDRLLIELANQVLPRLGLARFGMPDWATHKHALDGVELPIHPTIAAHFQLPWITPEHRYPLHGGWLSLDARSWYLAYAQALQQPGLEQGLQEAIHALATGPIEKVVNLCGLIRLRQPSHPGANALLAVVHGLVGRRDQAAQLLRATFTAPAPQPEACTP